MISTQQMSMTELGWAFPDLPTDLVPLAEHSAPLLGLFFSNREGYVPEPFCVIGLIPVADSAEANIWGWNTELVAAHSYAYAREGRRLIKTMLVRYPTITGFAAPWKRKWILSLGATILATTDTMLYFEVTK